MVRCASNRRPAAQFTHDECDPQRESCSEWVRRSPESHKLWQHGSSPCTPIRVQMRVTGIILKTIKVIGQPRKFGLFYSPVRKMAQRNVSKTFVSLAGYCRFESDQGYSLMMSDVGIVA